MRLGMSAFGCRRVRVVWCLAVWCLAVLPGCAAFDPGGQVSRGLGQSKSYEWSDTGQFKVTGNGPQTERFTMAQGDLVMKVDKDGNEVIDWDKSKLAYYLRADPKADDAANAMNAALIASTAQVDRLSRSFDNLLASVLPLLARPTAPTGGTSGNTDLSESLARLLTLLEQQTSAESSDGQH